MSQQLIGRFQIVLSNSDTLGTGCFIQIARVAGQGFFLVQLLDENKLNPTELSRQATVEGNRFTDAAGLEIVHHTNGLGGTAFLYGTVQAGSTVNRSIFVAEDDGGKGEDE